MDKVDQFVKKYEGKILCYPDGKYCGECLSLCKIYIKEVFNINPPPSGCNAARCYWSNFPDPLGTVLKKVPNTDTLIPKKGWIAVWNSNVGNGYGHIGSVISADVNTFVSLDQNWGGRTAHRVTHNYDHVYGFLVPLKEEEDMPDALAECLAQHTKLVTEAGIKDKRIAELEEKLEAEIQDHKKTAVKLDEVKQELSTVKKTLKEQRDVVASLSEQTSIMDKQVAAHKGEVTKKETEIAELEALLEASNKSVNWKRFTSRKFLGALLAIMLPILNQQLGWQLDATQMLVVLSPLLAFIGAEGWTDHVERTAE